MGETKLCVTPWKVRWELPEYMQFVALLTNKLRLMLLDFLNLTTLQLSR